MKRVAILLRKRIHINDKPENFIIRQDVIDVFKKYNVNYFLIPLNTEDNDDLKNIIDMISLADGVLIPGGKRGGGIEYDVIKYLYDNDIPTLGICYGMENMGRVFGGVKKKIDNHMHPNKDYVHDVIIKKDSLLYKIIGKDKIKVNSRHYNTVIDSSIYVSAESNDGVVEAYEDSNKRCFIGIQWHPESIIDDENSKKIFDYFINKL